MASSLSSTKIAPLWSLQHRACSRNAKRIEPCTSAWLSEPTIQSLLVHHLYNRRRSERPAVQSYPDQNRVIASITSVDPGSSPHKSGKLRSSPVPAAGTMSSVPLYTSSGSAGHTEYDMDDRSVEASAELHEGKPRQLSPAEHYLHQRPHWRHWYGLWTIWKATTGDVVDTYRMERFIDEVEAPGLKVVHNNIRHKPAGKEVNGPWVFDADASQPDGIAHPASPEFRSHQGPGGDFSYHFREVPEDPGKRFRVELFFMAPGHDTRASVLAFYDEQGDAMYVIGNRENDWDPLDKPSTWSASNATARERLPPSGKLTGVEYTTTTDLVLSEAVGTWRGYECPVGRRPTGDSLAATEYSLLHLPDGLSICLPTRVRRGMGAFHVSGHWQIDAQTVRQQTVMYGADGAFESFRVAQYAR